jgi:hypothetical protein
VFQQISDRAGATSRVPRFLSELDELSGGVATGAVHRLGGTPLLAAVGIAAEIDTQLPAIGSALTK